MWQAQRKIIKARKEEAEEIEDEDKFLREQQESDEEKSNQKGRGRGRGRGKGRGKGNKKGQAEDDESAKEPDSKRQKTTAEENKLIAKNHEKKDANKNEKPNKQKKQ